MPVICRFYGLIIKMFFNDHNPPHIHVIYNEYNALIDIKKLEVLEGDLPAKEVKMVLKWTKVNQDLLLKMWENQEFRMIDPLE